MAKGGKFTKLMKKLSFGKTTRSSSESVVASSSLRSDISFSSSNNDDDNDNDNNNNIIINNNNNIIINNNNKRVLHTVYVGKSRRRYLLTSEVVGHPFFQQLVWKYAGAGEEIAVIGCEVVLFEHLLWMLENADPQLESLEEIVDYYAC